MKSQKFTNSILSWIFILNNSILYLSCNKTKTLLVEWYYPLRLFQGSFHSQQHLQIHLYSLREWDLLTYESCSHPQAEKVEGAVNSNILPFCHLLFISKIDILRKMGQY